MVCALNTSVCFGKRSIDKYPKSEQATNYGKPIQSDSEIYPAPRFWFITESLNKLVQIQNNCFLCNWRKVEGEDQYPEYNEMNRLFNNNYSSFLEFLKEKGFNEPAPLKYEFNYVNHLKENFDFREAKELSDIIKRLDFPETLSGQEVKDFNLNYIYDLPDAKKGIFKLNLFTTTLKNTKQKIIVFENGASGFDSSNHNMNDWFDYVHEQLTQNFEKLTDSDTTKTNWEKKEVS